MIKPIDLTVSAAYPQLPIENACVFVGSAASFVIHGVPSDATITGVSLALTPVSGSAASYTAVKAGDTWRVTVPASVFTTSGTVQNGVVISASGKDENNTSVACWILGAGSLEVMNASGTVSPSVFRYVRYYTTAPAAPAVGDISIVNSKLSMYDGSTWKEVGGSGGSGTITDVQVDGTSVVSQGVANISLTGKQDVISDLATIRAGAALGATSIQAHQDISGKANTSDLTAEVTRATAAEDALSTALAGKQGTIADLSTIRSNAALARPKLDMNVYQIGQRPKWTFTCEGDGYLAEMLGLQDPTIDEQNGILTFRDKPDPFRESGAYGVWSIREYGTMSGGFDAELVEPYGEVEVGTTTSLMPIKTMVPDPSNPEVVSGDAVAKKSDFTLTQGQLPAGGYAAQLFSNSNGLLVSAVRYHANAPTPSQSTTSESVETTSVTVSPDKFESFSVPAPGEGNTTALSITISGDDTLGVRNVVLDVTNGDTAAACPIGLVSGGSAATARVFKDCAAEIPKGSRAIVTLTKLSTQGEWLVSVNEIASAS